MGIIGHVATLRSSMLESAAIAQPIQPILLSVGTGTPFGGSLVDSAAAMAANFIGPSVNRHRTNLIIALYVPAVSNSTK